jgi:hypothetical protein
MSNVVNRMQSGCGRVFQEGTQARLGMRRNQTIVDEDGFWLAGMTEPMNLCPSRLAGTGSSGKWTVDVELICSTESLTSDQEALAAGLVLRTEFLK